MHPLAGHPAPPALLVDVDALRDAYYSRSPDVEDPAQRVKFGTSGHRGSSLHGTFNDAHVLAITQAICDYRTGQGITRASVHRARTRTRSPSRPSGRALEVLAANSVEVMIDASGGPVPTPSISHAILKHNAAAPRDSRTAS